MKRDEAVKFLLEELKKVPNLDVCRVATDQQMKRIAAEIDFETMQSFWLDAVLNADLDAGLELKISEVPVELYTEVILYFCMLVEYRRALPDDDDIWNLEDEATVAFLSKVKHLFQLDEDEDFMDIYVSDFLEYAAKSDKPDF